MTECVRETVYIRRLLHEIVTIGLQKRFDLDPVKHYVDNKGAKFCAETAEMKRIKHLHIKYNYIKQCVRDKSIILEFVETARQKADFLTKALLKAEFTKNVKRVN